MKSILKKVAGLAAGAVLALGVAGCSSDSDSSVPVHDHEHTFATAWTKDATHHWHAATCEHTTEVKDKAEHSFGEWVSNNDATEAADGTKTHTCTVTDCGYAVTVTDEGSKIVKVTFTLMRTGKDESGNWTNTTYKVDPDTTWEQFIEDQNPPYYTVYQNGDIFHDNSYELECDCGGDYVYASGNSYPNYVTSDTVIVAGQYGCEYCFE